MTIRASITGGQSVRKTISRWADKMVVEWCHIIR